MATTDPPEFMRLSLQIQRDLTVEAHLSRLLTAARGTVAAHRRDLLRLTTRRAGRQGVKRFPKKRVG